MTHRRTAWLLPACVLLAACPAPAPEPAVPCVAQTTPSTDCMREVNDAKAQYRASVNAGKQVQFTEDKRLALAVESALRWLDVSPEQRLRDAMAETRYLRTTIIRPRIAPCLSPHFDALLTQHIQAGLTDTALANALALRWSHDYTDAQLAEIHRVALSGGTVAQLNPALFTGNAPTETSLAQAGAMAARGVYGANPAALAALVRSEATPQASCTLPTTETEWHNVLDYTPLYRRSPW